METPALASSQKKQSDWYNYFKELNRCLSIEANISTKRDFYDKRISLYLKEGVYRE